MAHSTAGLAVPSLRHSSSANGQITLLDGRGRFEDFRSVPLGWSVRGPAVFALVAGNHTKLTALRAGAARGPLVQHQHQDQAICTNPRAAPKPVAVRA
jgi:hypothetical protein